MSAVGEVHCGLATNAIVKRTGDSALHGSRPL